MAKPPNPPIHHLLLFFLLSLFPLPLSSADDSAAMTELASALSPTPTGWTGTNPCAWTGVNCDASNRVTSINLASQSLFGTLPSSLSSLSHLQTLNLRRNFLSGPLPSLSNLISLQQLYLNSNNFASLPSAAFSGLTNLQTLSMSDNPSLAPWTIPADLTQSTSLGTFYANNANIFGSIPDFFDSFPNLQSLRLSYNNLTGLLPASLMALPKLANISLQNNMLQGPFPAFGSNVTVTLGSTNGFCKSSPGPCDPQVTALLAVAGAIGYPISLAQSWVGNDACSQWTFITCNSQGNVTVVDFGKQRFSGTISPAFANLTTLKSLYLNDNSLTGSIPKSLTSLSQLQVLDVSNNTLSGVVPVFPSTVKFTSVGNLLLGMDISSGSGSGSNSSTSGGKSGGSFVSRGLIAGGVIAAVIFSGVVSFVCDKCCLRKRHQRFGRVDGSEVASEMVKSVAVSDVKGHVHRHRGGVPNELHSQSIGDHGKMPVVIPIQVLRKVTNNFSEENILGRGGFGVVYGGELPDGTKIAVKRMESGAMGTKGENEFQAEIGVLTKVRHRHLVALIGYCINGNERLLVYEHMPQGTLAQHLFEWRELGYSSLTWKQRVTIALDMARGVEYLHGLAQQSFIHRDLKPSNILLGDDMRAKVADFGLVKNLPDGKYSLETRLAGSFGYLAPEYAATGRVTTKVDVYAFGVVLMEIVTGRKVLDKVLDETVPDEWPNLVTWFRKVVINKESIRKAIDQTLEPDDETFDSICKVAELAGHCTAREPFHRPDMGHAVNVLGPLVEQWKPSSQPSSHEEEESLGIDLDMSLLQTLQSLDCLVK